MPKSYESNVTNNQAEIPWKIFLYWRVGRSEFVEVWECFEKEEGLEPMG